MKARPNAPASFSQLIHSHSTPRLHPTTRLSHPCALTPPHILRHQPVYPPHPHTECAATHVYTLPAPMFPPTRPYVCLAT